MRVSLLHDQDLAANLSCNIDKKFLQNRVAQPSFQLAQYILTYSLYEVDIGK